MLCSVPAEALGEPRQQRLCVLIERGVLGWRKPFRVIQVQRGEERVVFAGQKRAAVEESAVAGPGIALGSWLRSTGPSLVYTVIRWTGGGKLQPPTLILCSSICCTWDTLILSPSAHVVYLCPNNSNLYEAGSTNSSKVHRGFAASMLLQNTSCPDL